MDPEYKELNERISLYEQDVKVFEREVDRRAAALDNAEARLYVALETLAELKHHREKMLEERVYLYTNSSGIRLMESGTDFTAWTRKYGCRKPIVPISVPKVQLGKSWDSATGDYGTFYNVPAGSDVRIEEEPAKEEEERLYLWSNQACINYHKDGRGFLTVWDSRHYDPGEILVSIPQNQVEEDGYGWFTAPVGADVRVEVRDAVLAYALDASLSLNKDGYSCAVTKRETDEFKRTPVVFDKNAIEYEHASGYILKPGAKLYVLPKVDDDEEEEERVYAYTCWGGIALHRTGKGFVMWDKQHCERAGGDIYISVPRSQLVEDRSNGYWYVDGKADVRIED